LDNHFAILSDLSWISRFDEEYIRESFLARAIPTITNIKVKLQSSFGDGVSSDAGEYVVSELSRTAIQNNLIPFARSKSTGFSR